LQPVEADRVFVEERLTVAARGPPRGSQQAGCCRLFRVRPLAARRPRRPRIATWATWTPPLACRVWRPPSASTSRQPARHADRAAHCLPQTIELSPERHGQVDDQDAMPDQVNRERAGDRRIAGGPLHPVVRTRPRPSSSVTGHIWARSSRAQESDASAADALTSSSTAGPSAPPTCEPAALGRCEPEAVAAHPAQDPSATRASALLASAPGRPAHRQRRVVHPCRPPAGRCHGADPLARQYVGRHAA
jgi:hypothetical protein